MTYVWRQTKSNWLSNTFSIQLFAIDGSSLGGLKIIGRSGAVADTPSGAFSFRAGGADPMHVPWSARIVVVAQRGGTGG